MVGFSVSLALIFLLNFFSAVNSLLVSWSANTFIFVLWNHNPAVSFHGKKKKKTRPFKFHTKSAERISSCPLNSWLVRCGRTVLLQVLCSTPEENSQTIFRLLSAHWSFYSWGNTLSSREKFTASASTFHPTWFCGHPVEPTLKKNKLNLLGRSVNMLRSVINSSNLVRSTWLHHAGAAITS